MEGRVAVILNWPFILHRMHLGTCLTHFLYHGAVTDATLFLHLTHIAARASKLKGATPRQMSFVKAIANTVVKECTVKKYH